MRYLENTILPQCNKLHSNPRFKPVLLTSLVNKTLNLCANFNTLIAIQVPRFLLPGQRRLPLAAAPTPRDWGVDVTAIVCRAKRSLSCSWRKKPAGVWTERSRETHSSLPLSLCLSWVCVSECVAPATCCRLRKLLTASLRGYGLLTGDFLKHFNFTAKR